MVAVDMHIRQEQNFLSWMELRHCKQISVNVHSGSMLVQVFREVLLNRILQTESTNSRFLQLGEGSVIDNPDVPAVQPVSMLREDILRQRDADQADLDRSYSPAVSRCQSVRGGQFLILRLFLSSLVVCPKVSLSK